MGRMEKMKGFFVAFEGIDGAGKWTQLQATREWLEEMGKRVRWFSEPNDKVSPLARKIKNILNRNEEMPKDVMEFQRMYVVDRAQDVFVFVEPWLKERYICLAERFAMSTVAYGMLSGLPAQEFIDLHNQVLGKSMVWPNLTILLDLPAKIAVERIVKRSGRQGYFEKEKTLETVRQNYLSLVEYPEFKNAIAVVDASSDPNIVFNSVMNVINDVDLLPKIPQSGIEESGRR